jgi:hypothetical protein
MKFNKQELSNLACQSSNRFIKEGALVVYEKQDGVIFKRNESKSKTFTYQMFDFFMLNNKNSLCCLPMNECMCMLE